MADDAVHWMNEINDINPDMPFLVYYCPGGTYQVLPLDASASPRFVAPRPSQAAGRKIFNYSGSAVSIPDGNQPSILNTSYTITADIDVPQGGAEGVIVGEGERFYGYALYLLKGKPVFTYNLLDLKRTRFEGTESLAPGKHTIEYDFKYDGLGEATLAYNVLSGVGRGGTGTLKVDGKVVSTQKLERTLPLVKPLDQSFDIGHDVEKLKAAQRAAQDAN